MKYVQFLIGIAVAVTVVLYRTDDLGAMAASIIGLFLLLAWTDRWPAEPSESDIKSRSGIQRVFRMSFVLLLWTTMCVLNATISKGLVGLVAIFLESNAFTAVLLLTSCLILIDLVTRDDECNKPENDEEAGNAKKQVA